MRGRRAATYGAGLLQGVAAAGLLALHPARAAEPVRPVAVAAQPLDAALRELARQTGANILFRPDAVAGVSSRAVNGNLSAEDAVRAAIAGAALEVMRDRDGALIVRAAARPPPATVAPPPAPAVIRPRPARPAAAPVVPIARLQEVVVTANRKSETVNSAALSITAMTQRSLDVAGVKTVGGLVNRAPGLTVVSNNPGVSTIAIRGVAQSGQGAATTGVYLDDIPLQKRAVGGVPQAGANGTPTPPLFDLERVEVLRGPQGTLYGGSSEGGTVRLISPTPSLTTRTAMVRAETYATLHGGPSYELGLVASGPIVEDRLALRATFFGRGVGGYTDYVTPGPDGAINVWKKDADSEASQMLRLTGLWALDNQTNATLSYLSSGVRRANNVSNASLPTTSALTVYDQCYDASATPSRTNKNRPPQPSDFVNGVYDPNAIVAGRPIATVGPLTDLPTGDVDRTNGLIPIAYGSACDTLPGVTHRTKGGVYGPFAFKPYQLFQTQSSPSSANLQLLSLIFDHNFSDGATMRSITAYVDDQDKTFGAENTQAGGWTYFVQNYGGTTRVLQGASNLFAAFPDIVKNGHFVPNNKRYGVSQEMRFVSPQAGRRFTWVGGVFLSNFHTWHHYENNYDLDSVSEFLFGITALQRYGLQPVESAPGLNNVYDAKTQTLHDREAALFFEGTYRATSRLNVTAGARISRTRFDFSQFIYGPITGVGASNPDPAKRVPTPENGSANSGSVSETPITPRLAVNYTLGAASLLYASLSKGVRAGGVNAAVSPGNCGVGLNQYGMTFDQLPMVYKGDSVWSYELGGKFRLLDQRLQLNTAVYHVDWKNTQFSQPPPGCGLAVTYNLSNGGVVSEGLEIELQAALTSSLFASFNYSLNNAYYAGANYVLDQKAGKPVVSPSTVLVLKGQRLATPAYRMGAALEYRFRPLGLDAFARLDWTYSAGVSAPLYGTVGWSPDNTGSPAQEQTNLRLGANIGAAELDLFVTNLLNADKGATTGGRTGCVLPSAADPNADCHNYNGYTTFRTVARPRPTQIGVTLTWRR